MIAEGWGNPDAQPLTSGVDSVPKTAVTQLNLFAEQYSRRVPPITPGFCFLPSSKARGLVYENRE
jgi:hypothetical protein